jgi:hypothetical protein
MKQMALDVADPYYQWLSTLNADDHGQWLNFVDVGRQPTGGHYNWKGASPNGTFTIMGSKRW